MDAEFEAIVVGGGVVGAGIARDLAMRGVRTMLVEKRDFSAGTTGTCSGMIHGGLRYLEFDVATTQASCQDAGYIRKIAPHLCFRIPFLIPVYPEARYSVDIMETVLEGYGRFSPLKDGKPSARLTEAEALSLEPGLMRGMRGAVTLDEWGIDPFRLVLGNVLDAAAHGAVVKNHTEVVAVDRRDGAIAGVRLKSRGQGPASRVGCKVLVNAAGPWAPRLAELAGARIRQRPGKGTHLIFAGRISNYGLIAPAVDGRELLLVPHESCTLLGTTDDDYYGDPDDAVATREEADYLYEGAMRLLPELANHRVMRVMTGIRPTLYQWGINEDKLPREHALVDHAAEGVPGFFTMHGGKLATFRIMAEETASAVLAKLGRSAPCRTHEMPLPGGDHVPDATDLAREQGIDPLTAHKLVRRHGSAARRILDEGKKDRTGLSVACACEGVLECEVRHAIRHELCEDLADLGRRTRVGWGPCQGLHCTLRCAALFASEKGLAPDAMHRLAYESLKSRFRGVRPLCEGAQLAHEEIAQQSWAHAGYADLFGEGPPS
ncbi:MAG: FAD-dependent oxidoreductase [Acidobacteriota bacterium]